jgi:hypothetical protein
VYLSVTWDSLSCVHLRPSPFLVIE